MPLFVYEGKRQTISFDGRTKVYFGAFVVGGLALSVYSLYQEVLSFSLLYFFSLITGLGVSAGYAWLWKYVQTYKFHSNLLEVYPTHIFFKKYNDQLKQYEELIFFIKEMIVVIEKHIEPCQGVMYFVPVLHLYHEGKGQSLELAFDGEATMDTFLQSVNELKGEIRFLPYSLDYCTKEERLKALGESRVISFNGHISDYIPHNQEAFFYNELITYKDLLMRRKSNANPENKEGA